MSLRYLYGPVTSKYAENSLHFARAAGQCLAFGTPIGPDVTFQHGDDWLRLMGRLSDGFVPDCLVLYLPYTQIPAALWTAPVPIIALAPDWNLLWHYYRQVLPRCDLVLTDSPGVGVMRRAGIEYVLPANLFGLDKTFEEHPCQQDATRDIDILFVGNLHPAVQAERLPWIARLSRLGFRWNVVIRQGVFGDDYRHLLARSRIVFNRSVRGECNMRALEAARAGALLFQEQGNSEVEALLAPGEACVTYSDGNLEARLEHYLENEADRERIAKRGQEMARDYTFGRFWELSLHAIEEQWPQLLERAKRRVGQSRGTEFPARIWEAASASEPPEPRLVRDIAKALVADPRSAGLHNALGVATGLAERARLAPDVLARQVAGCFQRAAEADANHLVAGLNWVEALRLANDREGACRVARQTLHKLGSTGIGDGGFSALGNDCLGAMVRKTPPAPPCQGGENSLLSPCQGGENSMPYSPVSTRLAKLPASPCQGGENSLLSPCQGGKNSTLAPFSFGRNTLGDAGLFPPGFGWLRVEWEAAGWRHAGDPEGELRAKLALVRWRLHCLLADLEGDAGHAYEAVLERPDLPGSREVLGRQLLEAHKPAQAVPHLQKAQRANPFDLPTGRLLFRALGEAGDGMGQRRLADEYRLLRQAAPGLIAGEPWIAEVPPPGDELASIIILACNEISCTRLCLKSLLRTTRQPYELILVDNGSTDGTADYFQEIAARPGPARVLVLRNETNLGFPAGCNQGIQIARGRYLVFLNNDTVLTSGWLEPLIELALSDWPKTGMVGPMSNYTAAPQLVPTPYGDLAGLEPFAARRRHEFAGKALHVERLMGFCLLVRREVLEQIGSFDEQFGLGFFDDDDLSLRVRQAGFTLKVAQSVFIHHFGSQTFKGMGLDCAQHLRANFEQFKAKWGQEAGAGYSLPAHQAGRSSPMGVGDSQNDEVNAAKSHGGFSLQDITGREGVASLTLQVPKQYADGLVLQLHFVLVL